MKDQYSHINFLISPRFHVEDWKNAKEASDWGKMVEIFYDRLDGRFLKPIRLIADDTIIGNFSGFSILALDCLLIETLQQFYDGKDESKKVEESFIKFLTSSDFFKSNFNKNTAKRFYFHFRNGLLHQAQTKKKSLIKIKQKSMVAEIDSGLIIDRIHFHQGIENEIDRYKKLLLDKENVNLREKFIKKMNIICGLEV